MFHLALVFFGVLGTTPTGLPDISSPDLAAYQAARERVGGGAAGQVDLALWCEAHGLNAERMKHLALAVLADPSNVVARGLLGLVADEHGRWRRPEEIAERTRAEAGAALSEYTTRRDRTPETAEAQWKLALWCESKGLKPEAVAHLTAVTRLDPTRSSAWKHLGYKVHAGRWMTGDQIAAEATEADAQGRADRHWRPVFERARGYLAFKSHDRQEQAAAILATATDSRVVPSVVAVLGRGPEPAHSLGVQILGRIDSPASSRALAEFAVSSPWESIRRAAVETLRRRDPRDFVHIMIARLRDPITYHVRPVGGPGQAGELLVEGDQVNVNRVYTPPPLPELPITPGSWIRFDETGQLVVELATVAQRGVFFSPLQPALSGLIGGRDRERPANVAAAMLGPNSGLATVPFRIRDAAPVSTADGILPPTTTAVPLGKMVEEVRRAAYESRVQQRDDVQALEQMNAGVRKTNDLIIGMLAAVLGETTGTTRSDWERWYNDRRGYTRAPRLLALKSTVVQDVAPAYTPAPIGQFVYDRQVGYYIPNRDCFAAGTPVRTLDGPRPIEGLKVGDRVLAQDARTGSLGYQPVVAVHHNPPADTLRLSLGAETIVTTGIQRFWKARQGWVMARDLKPGDVVRALGGLARVESVESAMNLPVFNLEVGDRHDFFVGTSGVLVHDHTEVEPVERPFDSGPASDFAD